MGATSRRVLLFGGGLLAVLMVPLALQETLHPPSPPALTLVLADPDAPDYAASPAPRVLEAAGIHLELPIGTRIHPNSIESQPGLTRVRAALHGVSIWVTFYGEEPGALAEAYQAALAGDVGPAQHQLLFGPGLLVDREARESAQGAVWRFELQLEGGSRRTLLVLRPASGASLATAVFQYPFDPAINRVVTGVARQVRFAPAPAS